MMYPWPLWAPLGDVERKARRIGTVGRPDRGNRAKVKAGRKAARRSR